MGIALAARAPVVCGDHPVETLLWVYHVTWIPSLISGFLTALVLLALRRRMEFFTKPYDVWPLRISLERHHWLSGPGPYPRGIPHAHASSLLQLSWIAGALIAGCLTGAVVLTMLLKILLWARRSLKNSSLQLPLFGFTLQKAENERRMLCA